MCFEWEMVIYDETFAVTFLLTYIADQQAMITGNDSQLSEKLQKPQKFSHVEVLLYTLM